MIVSFKNDDPVYENWCKSYPNGFVLNRTSLTNKKTDNNKIHLSNCSHLTRSNGQGQQTKTIPKVCSINLSELIEEAHLLCGESWNMCQTCKKKIEK